MDTPAQGILLTLEEFERLPDDEFRSELVRGRLVREPPAGMDHGRLAGRFTALLAAHVDRHALGEVFTADTGFVLFQEPPTVRAPDVAFVSRDRLPPPEESIGFGRLAPDLAIEIVSPSNTATEILGKVEDYLEAGTRLVWVVEPHRRSVTVYRSRNEIRLLGEGDELDGYDTLPGFSLQVSKIFAD
ncbi:MAG TPA: Uma2 family endonuclease [Gemmatimonadota bacterium]|jgi:Uma2 family endonuclease|nr:Uma2 family endonuclease [Gemmatimonadota bacterium]